MDLFIAPYFRPDNMTPKICHFVTLKKVVPPLYRRFLFILTIYDIVQVIRLLYAAPAIQWRAKN